MEVLKEVAAGGAGGGAGGGGWWRSGGGGVGVEEWVCRSECEVCSGPGGSGGEGCNGLSFGCSVLGWRYLGVAGVSYTNRSFQGGKLN